MVHWFILLTMLITSSNGGAVDCSSCANTIVDCPDDGQTCVVTCTAGAGGNSGCYEATINCLDGQLCQVLLGGDESARLATINGKGATQLDVFTGANAEKQLEDANITCPDSANAHCNVHCVSSGYHNCNRLAINAEYSNTFWLSCENANEACIGINLWCPRKNNNADACTLDGQPDTSHMTQMKIYAVNGFRSMTIYYGDSTASIGTMYCLNDYSASCQIDKDNGCLPSGDITCNNPPTMAPTVSPTTSEPTTTQPTTNTPTTTTPTSAQPTTVNPTTTSPTTASPSSHPTTLNPTTTIPTTSTPTTSNPTTTIPTTVTPTTSNPTTLNPTTSQPTMEITSTGTTTDFTISFEIDADVTEQEINNIISQSLTAYSNVKIISTSINEGEVIVEITIGDDNADTTTIKNKIQDGLANEYDKDIDVTVTNNDSMKQDKNLLQQIVADKVKFILSIAIIVLLLICVCILIHFGRQRIKKKKYNKDAVEIENELTTLTPKQPTTNDTNNTAITAIDMNEPATTNGTRLTQKISTVDDEDIGSDSDENNDMYENNVTQGGTKQTSNEENVNTVQTKGDDDNMDEMYEKGNKTKGK